MAKTPDDAQLELYGILSVNPDVDLRTLVQKLGTPLTKLKKWKEQHEQGLETDQIATLVHTESKIIEKVATEVYKDIAEAAIPPIEDPTEDMESNEVITMTEFQMQQAARDQEVTTIAEEKAAIFNKKVITLQDLQENVQATAGDIVLAIASRLTPTQSERLTPKEIQSLTTSLTSVQNAFFNRPVTKINVNTQNNNINGSEGLSAFREGLAN